MFQRSSLVWLTTWGCVKSKSTFSFPLKYVPSWCAFTLYTIQFEARSLSLSLSLALFLSLSLTLSHSLSDYLKMLLSLNSARRQVVLQATKRLLLLLSSLTIPRLLCIFWLASSFWTSNPINRVLPPNFSLSSPRLNWLDNLLRLSVASKRRPSTGSLPIRTSIRLTEADI